MTILISTGCSVSIQSESTATAAPVIITATLPPAPTPRPSETPLPLPPTPTTAPVEGTASTQINVRAEPSTAGDVLGVIPANTKLQIIGKDAGENWWQISYPTGMDGKGWVAAKYVTTAGKPDVPVIGGGGANPGNGNVAIIQQKLNVRSGPGAGFDSLGTLNAQDVVNLIGKDANGAWLQIEFTAGPDGKGWINSAFAQAKGAENLPIITEAGLMVGTETPTGIPPTPTATLIPAPQDGDSAENPAVDVLLSATGSKSFQYSGDVSSPEGDAEDWVAFTTDGDVVYAGIECIGNDSIRVEFSGTGTVLECNQPLTAVRITADTRNLAHILANPSSGQLRYTRYILTVRSSP